MNQPPGGYGPPPNYGAPQPKQGTSTLKIVLIVLGTLFALGAGSCLVCVGVVGKAASDVEKNAKNAPEGLPASKPPPPPSTPPVTVSAKQLFADYHANEVAADEKYKGQNLLVSGTVTSIDKDAFGNIVLRLGGGDQFGLQSVMARLDDSQKAKAMSLSKGQPETVLCEGDGMVIGSPSLGGCQLE